MPAVLGFLAEQVGLEGEDVIENAVDPASLEPVLGEQPGALQVTPQRHSQRSVDPRLAADLRLLEKLEAAVEGKLPRPVSGQVHSVPSTSTRPSLVTRACTVLSAGSE